MKPKPKKGGLGDEAAELCYNKAQLMEIKRKVPEIMRLLRRFIRSISSLETKASPPLFKKAFCDYHGLDGSLIIVSLDALADNIGVTPAFAQKFLDHIWVALKAAGVPFQESGLEKARMLLSLAVDVMDAKLDIVPKPSDKPLGPADSDWISKLMSTLPGRSDVLMSGNVGTQSVKSYITALSEVTGLRIGLLLSRRRPQAFAIPRFALIYVLREDKEMGYEDIKRVIGFKHHGTAMHGYKQAQILMKQPASSFRDMVAKLRAKVQTATQPG